MTKLRRMNTRDLDLVLEWRNHPNVRKNMYNQTVITETEHKIWWDKICKNNTYRYLIYEYRGFPSGVVSFKDINFNHRHSSWAFYASPKAPRGTGARMEYLALEYAFEKLSLLKLFCEVLSYNTAVISMHKRFGFQQEGRFISQYLEGDNSWDIVRLAIFKSDWEKTQQRFVHLIK